MQNKYIIIFKDITDGFMDLKNINSLSSILEGNKELRNHLSFFLQNSLSNESNQAIMQMYNSLMGFDIFEASYSNHHLLEYKYRNGLQLRKKIEAENLDLETYIKDKYKNNNIRIYYVTKDIYINLMSIIKECIEWQYK